MIPCPVNADFIRLRTRECGDCMEWASTLHGDRGHPICTASQRDADGQRQQRQYSVRHLVWWLHHGAPPLRDRRHVVTTSCGNPLCVAIAHLVRKSRSKLNRESSQRGAWQGLAFKAKVSQARSRNSRVSDADIARIRTHEGPLKPLAKELGISESYAYMVRNGKNRRDYTNPFAGLIT